MTNPAASINGYVAALTDPTSEHLDRLPEAMADNVVVVGLVGAGEGLDAVRTSLANSQRGGLLSAATASAPRFDGQEASVELTLPAGGAIGGLILHMALDENGRISRVEQQMQAAPPAPPIPLKLTDEINQAVAGALANGTPIVVAYVDAKGSPHLSLRGSTQPYSDTQLAIWIRDPGGGLLRAIATNPRVALFYRDPATRAAYQFSGNARLDPDPEVREVVYANTPAPERNIDARRLGSAVVIDLDRVEGAGPSGRFIMER